MIKALYLIRDLVEMMLHYVISQTQSECRKYVGMDSVCQYMQIFSKMKLNWAFLQRKNCKNRIPLTAKLLYKQAKFDKTKQCQ